MRIVQLSAASDGKAASAAALSLAAAFGEGGAGAVVVADTSDALLRYAALGLRMPLTSATAVGAAPGPLCVLVGGRTADGELVRPRWLPLPVVAVSVLRGGSSAPASSEALSREPTGADAAIAALAAQASALRGDTLRVAAEAPGVERTARVEGLAARALTLLAVPAAAPVPGAASGARASVLLARRLSLPIARGAEGAAFERGTLAAVCSVARIVAAGCAAHGLCAVRDACGAGGQMFVGIDSTLFQTPPPAQPQPQPQQVDAERRFATPSERRNALVLAVAREEVLAQLALSSVRAHRAACVDEGLAPDTSLWPLVPSWVRGVARALPVCSDDRDFARESRSGCAWRRVVAASSRVLWSSTSADLHAPLEGAAHEALASEESEQSSQRRQQQHCLRLVDDGASGELALQFEFAGQAGLAVQVLPRDLWLDTFLQASDVVVHCLAESGSDEHRRVAAAWRCQYGCRASPSSLLDLIAVDVWSVVAPADHASARSRRTWLATDDARDDDRASATAQPAMQPGDTLYVLASSAPAVFASVTGDLASACANLDFAALVDQCGFTQRVPLLEFHSRFGALLRGHGPLDVSRSRAVAAILAQQAVLDEAFVSGDVVVMTRNAVTVLDQALRERGAPMPHGVQASESVHRHTDAVDFSALLDQPDMARAMEAIMRAQVATAALVACGRTAAAAEVAAMLAALGECGSLHEQKSLIRVQLVPLLDRIATSDGALLASSPPVEADNMLDGSAEHLRELSTVAEAIAGGVDDLLPESSVLRFALLASRLLRRFLLVGWIVERARLLRFVLRAVERVLERASVDLVARIADETPLLADACLLLSRPSTSDEAQVALARVLVLASERYDSVSCPWLVEAPCVAGLVQCMARAQRHGDGLPLSTVAAACSVGEVLACALGFKYDGDGGASGGAGAGADAGAARVSAESVAALLSSAGVSASAALGECARMMAQCVTTAPCTGAEARARLEAGTLALLEALALLRHPGASVCLREVVRWAASGDTTLVGAAARCVEMLVRDVDASRVAQLDAAFAGLTSCFVKNAATCTWDASPASPVRVAVTALARAYAAAQGCSTTAAAELAAIVGEPHVASAAAWHVGAADAPERVVERVRAALDDVTRARVVDACDAVCAAIGLAPCVPFA